MLPLCARPAIPLDLCSIVAKGGMCAFDQAAPYLRLAATAKISGIPDSLILILKEGIVTGYLPPLCLREKVSTVVCSPAYSYLRINSVELSGI